MRQPGEPTDAVEMETVISQCPRAADLIIFVQDDRIQSLFLKQLEFLLEGIDQQGSGFLGEDFHRMRVEGVSDGRSLKFFGESFGILEHPLMG